MNESYVSSDLGDPAKASQSPAQRGVTQLIDYVRVLVELADKPIWSLASYGNIVLHEEDLRDRIGTRRRTNDSIDASANDDPYTVKR